jgi:DNA replication and repair protein RecF
VTVAELRLQNLRCLTGAELRLHPGINLVTGDNGAGKTSLLEAIYLLGRGRSFRTRQTEQLIRDGEPQMGVSGSLRRDDREHRLSVRCDRSSGVAASVDGRSVESLAELAALFPVQVIDPGIHRLIEEGPATRRRWLDWAMFHVEPQFLDQWRCYRRALRQRNAALRTGGDACLWDSELARYGDSLTVARERLIEALQPIWAQTLSTLDAVAATLRFYRGWSSSVTLEESLLRHQERDRERGSTLLGPHHFDVWLRVEGRPARDTVSRGQQKLLGAAMALSMARLLAERLEQTPTLLLDDPAAELDAPHTLALLALASALGGQQIVTALRAPLPPLGVPDRVFHVERGEVKTL